MSIRRRKKTHEFTQINNAALRNPELSLKAKGLLAVMMSCPEDWQFYMNWLQKQSRDGKEAHQAAMKELEQHGYVLRERVNREKGRLEWEYLVDDEPMEKPATTMTGKPGHGQDATMTGFTVDGSAIDGKPATTNTDSTNTDSTKMEKREAAAPPARRETPTQVPAQTASGEPQEGRPSSSPVEAQISTRQTSAATDLEKVPAAGGAAGRPGETEAYLRRKLSSRFVDNLLAEVQPLGVDRKVDWFALPLPRVEELTAEAQRTHQQHNVKVPTRLRDLLDDECRRVSVPLRNPDALTAESAGKYDRSEWSD